MKQPVYEMRKCRIVVDQFIQTQIPSVMWHQQQNCFSTNSAEQYSQLFTQFPNVRCRQLQQKFTFRVGTFLHFSMRRAYFHVYECYITARSTRSISLMVNKGSIDGFSIIHMMYFDWHFYVKVLEKVTRLGLKSSLELTNRF